MKYSQLYENKSRGKDSFPIQYYPVDASHSQYVMPLHWHGEFEIIRVLEGEFLLYVENEPRLMKGGDVAFIQGGKLHRGEPKDCVYECVVFDLSILNKTGDGARASLLALKKGEAELSCYPEEKEELSQLTHRLFSALEREGEYFELYVSSLLYGIFYQLLSGSALSYVGEKGRRRHRSEAVASVADYVETHFSEKTGLSELAAASGLSEKYLCRIFKEYTGQTPVEYLNRIRVERAVEKLLHAEGSVTDVAYECGFEDPGYFSRVFKKYTGEAPSRYMRKKSLQ